MESLVALLTALGVGSVLTKLVDGIVAWVRGRHDRDQSAHERLDIEIQYRRRVEETLHETRRQLHKHGVAYEDMPAWPLRRRT